MVIGAAAGGAFAGILIGRNITMARQGILAASTSWKELEQRGLALTMESVGGFAQATGNQRPRLQGTVSSVPVTVSIHTDFVHYALTHVVAKPATARAGVVGIYPSPGGVLSQVRDWLKQDIEIGDPAFDEAFLITGDPPSAATELLAPLDVRELLCVIDPSRLASLKLDEHGITVTLTGVERDPTVLGQAIDLAVAAARG